MKSSQKDWILFINYNAYPCVVGGLEVFNLYLIDALSTIYNTHIRTYCPKNEHKDTVKVHATNKWKFTKLSSPLQTFLFAFKHRKSIKAIHISYTDDYWTHSYVYVWIKRLLGIPYILTIHDGNLGKWTPEWPFKSFFKNAHTITGVSDRIVEEYGKRSMRNDIVFTPPLVPFKIHPSKNLFRAKWSVKEDELIILYVGSIKPLKSVETLIAAFKLLTEKPNFNPKTRLILAGDGKSKMDVEQQAQRLGLDDQVTFLGNVKTEEISELYNLADIYTICSEYEGLPISTLEAFANKLPCVTSNSPGLIGLSENNLNTLTFVTKNEVEYAVELERLLNDIRLRKQLGDNGYAYYQKLFSYDKLVDKFKMIIDTI